LLKFFENKVLYIILKAFYVGEHQTNYSTIFPYSTLRKYSTAYGKYSTAYGKYSTAYGKYSTAYGKYSTASNQFESLKVAKTNDLSTRNALKHHHTCKSSTRVWVSCPHAFVLFFSPYYTHGANALKHFNVFKLVRI